MNLIKGKLDHLSTEEHVEMEQLLLKFQIFSDVPSITTYSYDDVDVEEAAQVKQCLYQINPIKLEHRINEVHYMFPHNLFEPTNNDWNNLCVSLQVRLDTVHFYADFHKLNVLIKRTGPSSFLHLLY